MRKATLDREDRLSCNHLTWTFQRPKPKSSELTQRRRLRNSNELIFRPETISKATREA